MKKYCEKCIWFSYELECFPSCDRMILNERFPQACSYFVQKSSIDEKIEVKDWLRYAYKAYRSYVGKAPSQKDTVRMIEDIRKQVCNGKTYKDFTDMEEAAIYFDKDS